LIAAPGNGADEFRYASPSNTLAKPMTPIISVANLSKTYASGLSAVRNVSLEIRRGEIFALLGPNGAGKTTLISIICGIVNCKAGSSSTDTTSSRTTALRAQ
jgi:ABC-type multidrug transport system ATPase subunit